METNRSNLNLIYISIGIIYLWFGALKFFPNVSPAEELAIKTIHELTFGIIPDKLSIILLAIWEVTIGICFLFNLLRKRCIDLALLHMVLTFTPFLFFTPMTFTNPPVALTLVGQYIIKNLVIIAVLLDLRKRQIA